MDIRTYSKAIRSNTFFTLRRVLLSCFVIVSFFSVTFSVHADNLTVSPTIFNLSEYFNYSAGTWYTTGTFSQPVSVTNNSAFPIYYTIDTVNNLDWCHINSDGVYGNNYSANWINPGEVQNLYTGISYSNNPPKGLGSMICLLYLTDPAHSTTYIIYLNYGSYNISPAIENFVQSEYPNDLIQGVTVLPPVTYTATINQLGSASYTKSSNLLFNPVNPADPPIDVGSGKVVILRRNDNSGCDVVAYGVAALPGSNSFTPIFAEYNPNFAKVTGFTSDLTYCGGPQITCTPESQTIPVNTNTNILFGGGNGTYTWSAPGALIPNGTGDANVRYTTTGTKSVTITSGAYTKTCTVNVIASNISPTVNAGPDKSITLPTSSSAPTSASAADSDGSVSSTVWTKISGPSATITNGSTLSPTFSNMTTAGTYTFRLTVTDNLGATVTDDMNVTVNSAVTTYSLTVNKSIGGSVTSADSFIACGASCTKNYNSGTSVTLTAVPASSYWRFIGWTGDCPAGTGTCSLTVNGNKSVTAVFAPVPFQYIEF